MASFPEAIADPKHERHKKLIEWRSDFDPQETKLIAASPNSRRARSPRQDCEEGRGLNAPVALTGRLPCCLG